MVLIALSLIVSAAPDLVAHYVPTPGRPVLTVSRLQWDGIRRALYRRDRKVLAALISDRNGVNVNVRWMHVDMGRNGKPHMKPFVQRVSLSKSQFLDIGKDDEYEHSAGPAVSTAVKGNTLYFKWLWMDLASVEERTHDLTTPRRAFDKAVNSWTWAMYGWTDFPKGAPSSKVKFAAADGKLVISAIDISIEPD